MTVDLLIIILLSLSMLIYLSYLIIFIIGFFLPRKHFSSEKPKVSVIIAARDEEECIARCINSICNQTYSKEQFEVIIVNDQSEDSTEEIVKLLQRKYDNLNLINIKDRPEDYAPKKYAISEALKISMGEIILTTDADITVKPTWIESIVSFFEKDVGLVVGFSSVRENQIKKFFQKFEALDFLMLMAATKGSIRIGIPISCSGQNLSFRKVAFDEVGGFGEENKTQSADDVLLLHLMRKSKNWNIAFADDENAYVETDATKSKVEFLKQRIRWAAMGAGQFTKSFNLTIINIATSVVNIGLLLLFAGYFLLSPELNQFLINVLIIKFVVELIVAVAGTINIRKIKWMWFFPFLFILYMPYILIISFFSMFGNFKWKERVYKKTTIK
jgi:cellulose synthase/poly-beta-1,6-N-acetylglucosamine synthase-like glycosyltransferase